MAEFGKLDFNVSLTPTSAFPLDGRTYFESLADAEAAAASAEEVGSKNTKYFYGQKLLVSVGGVDTWYVITRENKLEAEGTGGSSGTNLPAVTEADNGKVMTVVDGKWEAAELPKYAGAYEVTPSAHEEMTLNTAATYMDADVKVKKIPYYETTNEKGGDTVYIGSEV